MKKGISYIILSILLFINFIDNIYAYVNVKGYYKSNGTRVAPHIRSNPNGLKYDNYGWAPSQGLYNDTYGTRGSDWDTPTYITDPDYYEGLNIYNNSPSFSNNNKINVPSNASLNYYGTDWTCNSGYKVRYNSSWVKVGCDKINVPSNASLNYYGTDWTCNSGYKVRYNSSWIKVGCDKIY